MDAIVEYQSKRVFQISVTGLGVKLPLCAMNKSKKGILTSLLNRSLRPTTGPIDRQTAMLQVISGLFLGRFAPRVHPRRRPFAKSGWFISVDHVTA